MLDKIKNFFSEVRAEMQKVTWPTRDELTGSTGVVLVTMFFLSAFIGVADFVLSYVLAVIMR
jgi:preprotein translocase subunit SecE